MLSDESTAKFEIELVNKQVQKIKQAKKDCQTHYGKQLGCGTCKALQLCMWIDELVDTIEAMRKHIEALQQENEQLKEQINTAKIGWDTYKTYSEQLEQQTADLIAKKEELARRLIKQDNRNPAAGGGAKYKFR